jgi:pimeloyl-ACP methyl ester carboxylesterase
VQIRTVDIGVPVRYADYGGDGAPVVLLHGLGGIHLNWMRLAPGLTAHGRVLVPDLPGFGATPSIPNRTDLSGLRSGVTRFLDAVAPRGGPVTLVGNSLGGVLAMLAAKKQPERVARIVLISPAVPHAYFEPFDMQAAFTMGSVMLPFGSTDVQTRTTRLGPERVVNEMMSLTTHDLSRVPREVIDAHVEDARERVNRPWIGDAFTGALHSLSWLLLNRFQFGAIVRSVHAPTLVLAGERDRLVRARSIREACALNPRFVYRSWSDVGHVAQLEVPERILEAVDPFFAEHPIATTIAA